MDQPVFEHENLNPFDVYLVVKRFLNLNTTADVLRLRAISRCWNRASIAVLRHRRVVAVIVTDSGDSGMRSFVEFLRHSKELPSEDRLKYTDFRTSCEDVESMKILAVAISNRIMDFLVILHLEFISSKVCNKFVVFILRHLPNLRKLTVIEYSHQSQTPLQNKLELYQTTENWHSNLTALTVIFNTRESDDSYENLCWKFLQFCPNIEDLEIRYWCSKQAKHSVESLKEFLPPGKTFIHLVIADVSGCWLDQSQLGTMSPLHTFLSKCHARHLRLNLNTDLSETTEFQTRLLPSTSAKSLHWTIKTSRWKSNTSYEKVMQFFNCFSSASEFLEKVHITFRVLYTREDNENTDDDYLFIKPAQYVKSFVFDVRAELHSTQSRHFLKPPSLTDASEVKWFLKALSGMQTIRMVRFEKQGISCKTPILGNSVLFGNDLNGKRDQEACYNGLLDLPNLNTVYLYDDDADMNSYTLQFGFIMLLKLKKLYLKLQPTTWNVLTSSPFWLALNHRVQIHRVPS